MVDRETNVKRTSGVTTVRIVLTNTNSTPQTVRLRNRLEGPVWPPQRNGVVDPQGDDDTWEGTIQPGRSCGVGFASPSPPTDPPVEIVSSERQEASEPAQSSATVLADLDDWCPTSAVLEHQP